VLESAGKVTTIEVRGGTFMPGRGTGINDAHGTWLAGGDGSIWLYANGTMTKVATIPPQPGATGQAYDPHAWRSVAGPCQ